MSIIKFNQTAQGRTTNRKFVGRFVGQLVPKLGARSAQNTQILAQKYTP